MVIAQQVQDGVDCQIARLAAERIAEALGLIPRTLERDSHIAQRQQTGLRIDVLLHVLRELPRRELEHRKRQHICLAVNVPHGAVDGADARVIRDEHVDLAGNVHMLGLQRSGDALAQVQRQRQAAVCAVGIAHNDLMLHGFLLYTFFCPGRPFFALCSAVS